MKEHKQGRRGGERKRERREEENRTENRREEVIRNKGVGGETTDGRIMRIEKV